MQEVIEFATRNNGLEYSEGQMIKYRDEALEILSQFPENEYNISLRELVNYVVERKK